MSRNILNALLLIVSVGLVPQYSVAESISGSVPDVGRRITASGMSVMANFGHITYGAQLANVRLADNEEERFEFDVDLSDISLRIGRTSLKSAVFSADVATLPIELARTRPLVVRYVATRTESGLSLQDTRLSLSTVDVQIGSPNVVRTSGFGATKARVGKGLREGLRNNRDAIEGILLGEAKNIFSRIQPKMFALIKSRDQLAQAKSATVPSAENNGLLPSSQSSEQDAQTLIASVVGEERESNGKSNDLKAIALNESSASVSEPSPPAVETVDRDSQGEEVPEPKAEMEPEKQIVRQPVGKIAGGSESKAVSLSARNGKDIPIVARAKGSPADSRHAITGQERSVLPFRSVRRFAAAGLVYCQPVRPQIGTRLIRLLRLQ